MAAKMIREAEQLLADSTPAIRKIMQAIYDYFVSEAGCDAYVKTIYIGFQLGGELVAAAYPHSASVEVALALPDDTEGSGLVDAAHLTWRTMPVAVEVRNLRDLEAVRGHMETAVERVRTGAHDVELPQERFMGRERRIADQTILGKRAR
jgi:hypothetical protein